MTSVLPSLLFFAILWILTGCGVKGDPVPPSSPPELGRGQPTYRRAVEDLRRKQSQEDEDPQIILENGKGQY